MLDRQTDYISSRTENYNCLDIVKFICSLLVVIIHTAPFSSELLPYGDLLYVFITQYICRLAVPFFFVSSGFLLFNKMDIQNIQSDSIKKYIFKMLRHYGTWTLLLFIGSKGQLWYIGASAVAVLVLFFLLKIKIKLSIIVCISILCFFFGIISSSYSFFFESLKSFGSINFLMRIWQGLPVEFTSGICFGMFYILLGALVSDKKIVINSKTALILFALSMLLLLAEVSVICFAFKKTDTTMFVFHVPAVLSIFCFVINVHLSDGLIYRKLRILSVLVFYLHNFVNESIWFVISLANKYISFKGAVTAFLATLVIVIAISYLIEFLSHRRGFSWMKYLYN